MWGCDVEAVDNILSEFQCNNPCTVTLCHKKVTLMSRRLHRREKARKQGRKRKEKSRKKQCHTGVTAENVLPSSSSSSSSLELPPPTPQRGDVSESVEMPVPDPESGPQPKPAPEPKPKPADPAPILESDGRYPLTPEQYEKHPGLKILHDHIPLRGLTLAAWLKLKENFSNRSDWTRFAEHAVGEAELEGTIYAPRKWLNKIMQQWDTRNTQNKTESTRQSRADWMKREIMRMADNLSENYRLVGGEGNWDRLLNCWRNGGRERMADEAVKLARERRNKEAEHD